MQNDNVKLKIGSWKTWPYWLRGVVISTGCILLLTIIISIVIASSSLCGFNTAGESHTCNLSERIYAFGEGMKFILIFPFINTFHSIFAYHSWKILLQATDGFIIVVIIFFILFIGSGLGWLYGKIKNRRSNIINNQKI